MRHRRAYVFLGGVALIAILGGAWVVFEPSPFRFHDPSEAMARRADCGAPEGQVLVPDGVVTLGEDGPGSPGRRVHVPAFAIDVHEVTNREFAAFVQATGYRTIAEKSGGAVFVTPTALPRGLDDPSQWWRLDQRADWRHPRGARSTIRGRMDDPVVQVAYADAQAYARWKGRALPTVAQWERAARGDQDAERSRTSWAYGPAGAPLANTWQGVFPVANTGQDGFDGLAPVGCFAPNILGVHDMIGNAWEWTTALSGTSRIIKGGSFLCSMTYCANFRPAGWQAQEADLPTSHVGFRTVAAAPGP